MIAILALGETFVIIAAGIDLSVGAVVGFATVAAAWAWRASCFCKSPRRPPGRRRRP